MAELAPLTSAHAHARKAAEETVQIHLSEAADEHQHAAADFARAARGTNDYEALRILKLLEEQHLKLANIIKTQDSPVESENQADHFKSPDPAVSRHDFAQPQKEASSQPSSQPSKSKSTTSALAAARFGSQTRDSSPSLARDIASRRGIPQPGRNPPSAAAQARARQLSPESHRRSRLGPTAPKIPPPITDSQNMSAPRRAKKQEDDAAFASFYSNITTGTMSKLSSVLAYAGLPLTAEDAKAEQDRQKLDKKTVKASNDPDVKKIFSKAALDAIEDDHRQRGLQGGAFGPAESFYVVQTGGGTYSYADIAKAQKDQLGGIDEDDEEAFVDAREAQAPTSPRHSRHSSQGGKNSFGKNATHEELELQNATLKATLEKLATRLADFESHAQDASMAALTQSMASIGHQGGGQQNAAPDPALNERLRQLELQLEQQAEESSRLQNLASKQEKTLKQYKNKWDELKKSARDRDRAKRGKGEKAGEESSAPLETDAS